MKMVRGLAIAVGVLCAVVLLATGLVAQKVGAQEKSAKQSDSQRIDPESIHVLAVGVCVPWNPQRCCAPNVRQVTNVFVAKAQIPRGNIKLLLDSEVTHQGIVEGLDWLRRATSPSDTAIFVYIGHGGRLPDTREAKKRDFLHYLTLWSEEEPKSRWSALNRKTWISSEEFADLFNAIPAQTKILLLDSCYSGVFIQPHPENRQDRLAVVSSCPEDQPACFTSDKTATLFIFHLLKAIHDGTTDLHSAFQIAKGRTTEDSRKVIAKIKKRRAAEIDAKPKRADQWPEDDEQTPQLIDPRGVTTMLKFNAGAP